MKNLVLYIVSATLLLNAGCTNDFEEINTNPNQAVSDPSLELLFGSILPGFIGQVEDAFIIPGQFAQQFAIKDSEAGLLTQDDDAISRRTWEIVYSENNGALRNATILSDEAKKQNNRAYEAIGNIYRVYMLSYTTDLFGDIPYDEAGNGSNLTPEDLFPAYDPQEEVYASMLEDLANANRLLAESTEEEEINEERDLLFSGDKLRWRKFANAMRLRLLLRMSQVQDVSGQVRTIFETEPLYESNEDTPAFSFANPENWPFDEDREYDDFDSEEIRLSSTLVNILNGEGGANQLSTVQDPRVMIWLKPTDSSVTLGIPEYVGQPVGVANDTAEDSERSLLSETFRELNTFWLSTYTELLLIKTEAIVRNMIPGSAQDTYREAVLQSILRYGGNLSEASVFLNNVTGQFNGNEIKHIAIQRWLDQPNNGFEGYSVWRRMDFPVLELGKDVVAEQIPTRYFYSSKTTDKNQANADIAIGRAPLNGNNTIFEKVWWDSE